MKDKLLGLTRIVQAGLVVTILCWGAIHIVGLEKSRAADDVRLQNLEDTMKKLSATPEDLREIKVLLNEMQRGQSRIETGLKEHIERTSKP